MLIWDIKKKRNGIEMRIAICDDTNEDIDILKERLYIAKENLGLVEMLEIKTFNSGEDIIDSIIKERQVYDLIIMDVQLGGMSGKEAIRVIREREKEVVVCIMSRNETPIPSDFKLDTYRYIMKDDEEVQIIEDLESLLTESMRRIYLKYIFLNTENEYRKFDVNNILYVSKLKHSSELHTINEGSDIFIIKERLKEIEIRLRECGFEYAHNSYMVNYRKINAFIDNGKAIRLDNGEILNISRSNKNEFIKGHMKLNTREIL